jgi:hypothetical protein
LGVVEVTMKDITATIITTILTTTNIENRIKEEL